ncbi:hypothetical protein GC163_10110 [bacterium]|nr:hypothetical protein [bacterium]
MTGFVEYPSSNGPGQPTRQTFQTAVDHQKRLDEAAARIAAKPKAEKKSPAQVAFEARRAREAEEEEERLRPKRGFAPGDRSTVGVALRDPDVSNKTVAAYGTIPRELIRQALLLAAQNQLGLRTIDLALGEQPPVDELQAERFPFEIHATFQAEETDSTFTVNLEIVQREREGEPFKWAAPQFAIPQDSWLESLAERMEQMSREEFTQVLITRGYEKRESKPSKGDRPTISPQMDVVSQFVAVRQLQQALQAEPDASDLLMALSRTYANLGILTETHWGPMSKVFKSRSLLYAQQNMAKSGTTPDSLACRAYARALTGTHRTALADLQAARELDESKLPLWLRAIEAFCRYDFQELSEPVPDEPQLTSYLAMRMSNPAFDQQQAQELIQEFIKKNPACQQAIERACQLPLDVHRAVVSAGFPAVWIKTCGVINGIPELPATIQELAQEQALVMPKSQQEYLDALKVRRQLIDQLRTTTFDPGVEPSWNVLGELLHDQTYLQAWHTIALEKYNLGVPTDETLPLIQPLMQGHRYEKFLMSYVTDRAAVNQALSEIAKSANDEFLEPPAHPVVIEIYRNLGSTVSLPIEERAARHGDRIEPDLNSRATKRATKQELASWSDAVCPHRPDVILRLIAENIPEVQQRLPEWEAQFQNHAVMLSALATAYRNAGRPADAQRTLQRVAELEPTWQSYSSLYYFYAAEDDQEKMEATLKTMQTLPTQGLESADTAQRLAYFYMHRGDWEQAEPYAREAAASYAGWGLQCLSDYAEGVKDWELAEDLQKAQSQRYEAASYKWWAWCERTGRGDKAEARRLAEAYWDRLQPPLSKDVIWWRGISKLADHDQAAAEKIFTQGYRALAGDRIPADLAVLISLLADERGDTQARDVKLSTVAYLWEPNSAFPELVNLMKCFLRDGDQATWNEPEFDRLLLKVPSLDVVMLYYFAGKFLSLHNQPKLSQKYLTAAATAEADSSPQVLLAVLELRKTQTDLGPTRVHNTEEDLVPILILLRKNLWAVNAKDWTTCEQLLTEALKLRPDYLPTLLDQAQFFLAADRDADAISTLQKVLQLDARCDSAHFLLTQIYASSDDESIRDGKLAVKHAMEMEKLRCVMAWGHHQAQAAAYAEAGDFSKAIELQNRVLSWKPKAPFAKQQLELYKQSKPWRMQYAQSGSE